MKAKCRRKMTERHKAEALLFSSFYLRSMHVHFEFTFWWECWAKKHLSACFAVFISRDITFIFLWWPYVKLGGVPEARNYDMSYLSTGAARQGSLNIISPSTSGSYSRSSPSIFSLGRVEINLTWVHWIFALYQNLFQYSTLKLKSIFWFSVALSSLNVKLAAC